MTKFKAMLYWLFPPAKAREVDGVGVIKFLRAIGWKGKGK